MPGEFRIGPADLRRALRTGDEIVRCGPVGDLAVVETEVVPTVPVTAAAVLLPAGRDVSARVRVQASWQAACRRCAEPITGEMIAEVHEIFAIAAVEGETYAYDGEELDLEALVRDTVALGLPLAPAHPDDDEECRKTVEAWQVDDDDDDGDSNPSDPPLDPRWAALDQLADLPEE